MRRALGAAAILIVTLVPASGRTAVDTRVVTARGQVKSTYFESHGYLSQSYDLYGTFKTNGVTYTGHVTGYWSSSQYSLSSVFSGSDNGVISGSCYPSTGPETIVDPNILICHFSINYTRTAEFILQFVWTAETPQSCENCNKIYSTGIFVGV